ERSRPGARHRQAVPGNVRRRRGTTHHGLRSVTEAGPEHTDVRLAATQNAATRNAATRNAAIRNAVADAHRREWAFVLAATARVASDIDLAEECVQDAYVRALDAWTRDGVPSNPGAWLTTAARRRALDALRRDRTLRAKLPLLVEPVATEPADEPGCDEPG